MSKTPAVCVSIFSTRQEILMSLHHDLQNLPRISDEDREAIEDQRNVTPSLMTDEAIAKLAAAFDAGETATQPTAALSFTGDEAKSIVAGIIATARLENSQAAEREQVIERAKVALSRPKGKLELKLKEFEQDLCLEASTIEVCRDACSDDDISMRDVLTRAHHKLVTLVSELYEMGRNVGDLEAQQLETAKQ
jgi:hypothetical protein